MASTVNFSGIGSGIDFGAVRDAIVAQRSVPILRMQSQASLFNNRVEALKKLNTILATLTTSTQALKERTVGTGRSATVGDPTIASVTTTSSAALGNVNLDVTRLATSLSQASRTYASADAPVLAGGAQTATFQINKGGSDTGLTVVIDSTNNSLTGMRDAINAQDAGVSASIVDVNGDGTGLRLVLTSTETGSTGRVELLETTATGTGADLALETLNPIAGDFSKLDASFSLNGLAMTRSTNDVANALSGLNIKLTKVGSTSISVSRGSDIADRLNEFVTAYNAAQDFIGGQYQKNSTGQSTGLLASDSILRNVQHQLSSIVSTESLANGGELTNLAQIGIELGRDGKMTLDTDVLAERMRTNPTDVEALLHGKTSSDTGIFQAAFSISNALSDNISGDVQTAINGYQSSVKSLNKTIVDRQAIIELLRESLNRQFAAADAAIAQLNSQGTSLASTITALTNSNSN